MTIDVGTSTAGGAVAESMTGPERLLAETLAETAGIGPVPADSNFFDELGLELLTIAHFCARVRRSAQLPSISVRDCYQHPTIRGLAASLPELDPDWDVVAAPAAGDGWRRASTCQFLVCGTLQLLVFLVYASVAGVVFSVGYDWISAGPGAATLPAVGRVRPRSSPACALPILVKWLLVGRWKPRQFPCGACPTSGSGWSEPLIQLSPLARFVGCPLFSIYLRLLGAKIGRGVVILSPHRPGVPGPAGGSGRARSSARTWSSPATARVDGVIQTGRVSLGRDVAHRRHVRARHRHLDGRRGTARARAPRCTRASRCPRARAGTARPRSRRPSTTGLSEPRSSSSAAPVPVARSSRCCSRSG